MPVRENKLLHPFDLELMKCILPQNMPYNIPNFLLISFQHCYHNNCLGYGLVLTSIFQHLGINVLNHQTQYVKSSNIVSHLNLPPRPLIIFELETTGSPESHLNLLSHIDAPNTLTQLSLQNQSNLLSQIESLQLSVHHLRDMLYMLMELQKISVPPYHFSASTSSAKEYQSAQTPQDDTLTFSWSTFLPCSHARFLTIREDCIIIYIYAITNYSG